MKKTILCALVTLPLLGTARAESAAQGPAFFGAQMAPLTDNIRRDLDIKTSKGAAIGEVTPDGPAAIAGLKADDVIVGIDTRAVGSPQDVIRIVASHKPGDQIAVQILDSAHDHRAGTITVTLSVRPSGFHPDAQPGPQPVPGPTHSD
jgi:S1-C subfamily serine protease